MEVVRVVRIASGLRKRVSEQAPSSEATFWKRKV